MHDCQINNTKRAIKRPRDTVPPPQSPWQGPGQTSQQIQLQREQQRQEATEPQEASGPPIVAQRVVHQMWCHRPRLQPLPQEASGLHLLRQRRMWQARPQDRGLPPTPPQGQPLHGLPQDPHHPNPEYSTQLTDKGGKVRDPPGPSPSSLSQSGVSIRTGRVVLRG